MVIVRESGGLPLALEAWVAAQAVVRGPMGRVLDEAWELTPSSLRGVLVQCAAFRGPFDIRAAEAVIHVANVADSRPGDLGSLGERLEALHGLGWLELRRRTATYAMLAPLRAFAGRRLAADRDAQHVRRRHAEWFASRAAEVVASNDLRAAWTWGLERGEDDLAARAALTVGASSLRNRIDPADIDRYAQLLARPSLSPVLRVRLQVFRARLLDHRMQFTSAHAVAVEAAAGLKRIDDPVWAGRLAVAVAQLGWGGQALPDVRARLDAGIALLRAAHADPRAARWLASALAGRATYGWWTGLPWTHIEADLIEARQLFGERPEGYAWAALLELQARVTDGSMERLLRVAKHGSYGALGNQANLNAGWQALAASQMAQAATSFTRARRVARRAGFVDREVEALGGLTDVALRLGRFGQALAHCNEALALRGVPSSEANPMQCRQLGLIAASARSWDECQRWLDHADAMAHREPWIRRMDGLRLRAGVLEALGYPEAAARDAAIAEQGLGQGRAVAPSAAARRLRR